MSHWQKVKTHNKVGDRKKEIEKHFGIKSDEGQIKSVLGKITTSDGDDFPFTTRLKKQSKPKKKSK